MPEELTELLQLEAEAAVQVAAAIRNHKNIQDKRKRRQAILAGQKQCRRGGLRLIVIPAGIGAGVAAARASARDAPKATVAAAGTAVAVAVTAIALTQLGGGHHPHPYARPRPSAPAATAPPVHRPSRRTSPGVTPPASPASVPTYVQPVDALPSPGSITPDLPHPPAVTLPHLPEPPVRPTVPPVADQPIDMPRRSCLVSLRPIVDYRLVCRRS